MFKRVISFLLILSTFSAGSATLIYAEFLSDSSDSVIDSELMSAYQSSENSNSRQSVMVWLSDLRADNIVLNLSMCSDTLNSVLFETDSTLSNAELFSDSFSLSDYRDLLRNHADEFDRETSQALLREYRSLCAEQYLAQNSAFADEYLSEYAITYISHYSPVIITELSEDEALTVATQNDVQKIRLYAEPEESENNKSTADSTNSTSLTPAEAFANAKSANSKFLDMTHVNGGYSSLGLSGNGIVVGTVDFYGVSQDYLSVLGLDDDHNDWESGHSEGAFAHSTNIAALIKQIAPNCELYCASATLRTTIGAVEWLLDQDVNILSLSYSDTKSSTYNTMAQWLDGICYTELVTAVVAAGNVSNTSFADWALGYNVITVGNVDIDGTISSTSSYNTSSSGLAYKPDICAPGVEITLMTTQSTGSGTSYAAPIAAGICALIMEENSTLTYAPDLVKSIVTAGVNPSYTDSNGILHTFNRNVPTSSNYAKYGAGIIDFVQALTIVRSGTFDYSVMTANKTQTDEYTARMVSGKTYRVSLSFMRPVTYYSADNSYTTSSLANLNLKVYDPSGNLVASSTTTKNNVEIVEFQVTTTGKYTIQVICSTASSKGTYYSVAWNAYS
jgi:hypothetical protein